MQVELFETRMKALGVFELVDKVKEVSVDITGLPGYSAFLLGCSFGVPVKTYVSAELVSNNSSWY